MTGFHFGDHSIYILKYIYFPRIFFTFRYFNFGFFYNTIVYLDCLFFILPKILDSLVTIRSD